MTSQITAMIGQDWAKSNDDTKQVAGVSSSLLRGRDPTMTLQAFQSLWCHDDILASVGTVQSGTGAKLELDCGLFASYPVALFQ